MGFTVKFESHKDKLTKEEEEKINAWLDAIGQDAVSTTLPFVPVDTGRLKNSIAHEVSESEKAVYIGTNVEYAVYQEVGTSKIPGKHFLQFGATAHKAEYQKMLEDILKEE